MNLRIICCLFMAYASKYFVGVVQNIKWFTLFHLVNDEKFKHIIYRTLLYTFYCKFLIFKFFEKFI